MKLTIESAQHMNMKDLAQITESTKAIINAINSGDLPECDELIVDMSCANDEFTLCTTWNGETVIEVVTKVIGMRNDLDFVENHEDEDEYEFCGNLSAYKKLGGTNRYYREM